MTCLVMNAALGGLGFIVRRDCIILLNISPGAGTQHTANCCWAQRQHCLPSWAVAGGGTLLSLSLHWQDGPPDAAGCITLSQCPKVAH